MAIGDPRHAALVRVTHWVTALCFFALLVSGIEVLISHPRFYWGETGSSLTEPLFRLPIPASRQSVPTGFGYVLPDQNGWSRALHFQSAWVVVFAGLIYGIFGFWTGHFRRALVPPAGDLSWRAIRATAANHLVFRQAPVAEYNLLQRLAYLAVIFILFPLAIWTGLAMSPGIASAFPGTVTAFGGQQSARTIHFFVSILLTLFVLGHVVMVGVNGFRCRMRAMITGRKETE